MSGKLQTLEKRRLARSMLAGAPLFPTQLGAYKIRKLLSSGDDLISFDLAAVGTAGQSIKTLGKITTLNVLRIINKTNEEALTAGLLQHADDLDYVQNLLSLIGAEPGVNPAMNAVLDAFSRRHFSGRFKTGNQNVKLDALLNSGSKVPTDDDEAVGRKTQKGEQRQSNAVSQKPCFLYQNSNCSFRPCRYRHVCLVCQSPFHGSNNCDVRNSRPTPDRPPHPRYRRARAQAD